MCNTNLYIVDALLWATYYKLILLLKQETASSKIQSRHFAAYRRTYDLGRFIYSCSLYKFIQNKLISAKPVFKFRNLVPYSLFFKSDGLGVNRIDQLKYE